MRILREASIRENVLPHVFAYIIYSFLRILYNILFTRCEKY